MRKLALALAIGLLAIGCKHPGSAKLEGHWRGVRAEGVTPQQQDAANAFAMATEIIARGEKLTVSTPGSKNVQSVYVVDDENKTTVVLHTEKDGANAKETFTFEGDGKTMTWKMGGGTSIVFHKLKD
ncbi:MAG: hypothetical protein JST00_10140 [Deltaproteobacteria bacterium]|nr:hypothetical protein [Deltaproteobacteria bacterium]